MDIIPKICSLCREKYSLEKVGDAEKYMRFFGKRIEQRKHKKMRKLRKEKG